MNHQIDVERLDEFVTDGWLRRQRHPEADLWIYNYTEKTQYENHWTPETLMCRGLILDRYGFIRARPFPKLFNLGSPQVPELPAGTFTVTEKIDGSLGILYWLGGEAHIATRGRFDSEQAIEGTRMLRERTFGVELSTTPLFEIVYPENRIVVDYGDRRELILLAAVDWETGEDANLPEYDGPVVERHDAADFDRLRATERPNHEGYVLTFKMGLRVKVKHPEYVRLHKLITGVNARHIWEFLREGDDLEAMLDGIPDELYAWISGIQAELLEAFNAERDRCQQVFDLRPTPGADERKVLAAYFQANPGANTAVLFRMLDGKPYDDLIWKSIKPEPTTPDTIWTRKAAPDTAPVTGKDRPHSPEGTSTGQLLLSTGARSSSGVVSGDGEATDG
jgi:hypothetical protein